MHGWNRTETYINGHDLFKGHLKFIPIKPSIEFVSKAIVNVTNRFTGFSTVGTFVPKSVAVFHGKCGCNFCNGQNIYFDGVHVNDCGCYGVANGSDLGNIHLSINGTFTDNAGTRHEVNNLTNRKFAHDWLHEDLSKKFKISVDEVVNSPTVMVQITKNVTEIFRLLKTVRIHGWVKEGEIVDAATKDDKPVKAWETSTSQSTGSGKITLHIAEIEVLRTNNYTDNEKDQLVKL